MLSEAELHSSAGAMDIFIPVIGVAVIVLVYFDGIFTAVCELIKELRD